MIDDDEILFIDIIEHCLKVQNFSCAYIQKTYEMPYLLAGRLLDACEEMGVLKNGKIQHKYEDFKKNKKHYVEVLIKYNLM